MTSAVLMGMPDAGNPRVASTPSYGGAKPRRGSLLYSKCWAIAAAAAAVVCFAGAASAGVVMTSTGEKVENPLACGYVLPTTEQASYTFEAWLKMPPAALSATAYAMGVAVGGQTRWACFYLNKETARPSFRTATTGTRTNVYLQVSEDVPFGSWIHLAAVRDVTNGQVLLYTNGVLDVAYSLQEGETFDNSCSAFFGVGGLGLGWDNSRVTWKGSLSDVRVWSTARTAAEIAANYARRLAGNEEGLAVYYPLTAITNNATVEYVSRRPVRVNDEFSFAEDATAPLADNPSDPLRKAAVLTSTGNVSAKGYGVKADRYQSLTLEGWVKAADAGGPILCQGSNNSAGRIRLSSDTDRKLQIVNNTWGKSTYSSEKDFFPADEWVHVAVVRDYENAQLRIYRNGVRVEAFDSTTGSNSTDQITVATMNATKPGFNGSLLEMRAWTTARTDEQIADMYRKMAYGNEPGLIVCVHFNEEDSYYGRNVCGTSAKALSFGSGTVSWVDDPDLPKLAFAAETVPSVYFTGNGVTAGRTFQRYDESHESLDEFTFEAWVYPKYLTSDSIARDALCCRAGGSAAEGSLSIGFEYRGSPYMYLKAAKDSGEEDQLLAKDIENAGIDRWDHFSFVREKAGDGSYTARIYHNGTLLNTAANFSSSKIYATDFVIGGRSVTTTSSGFIGGIREVRVWNVARTTEAIAADYAKQLNGREKGLVGYWPCAETNGMTLVSGKRSVADGELGVPFVDLPKLTLAEADKLGAVILVR